jgi:hypothetical protein
MKYYDLSLGLFGWADNDIGIFGGTRADGFHPAGHLRANFLIYDTKHKMETGDDLQVGRCCLLIKLAEEENTPPSIVELHNFEIKEEFRGMHYGKRAVEALQRALVQDIDVVSIKKSKIGFWKKAGVENIKSRSGYTDGTLKASAPELEPENLSDSNVVLFKRG